jgi:hypothetical protein
VIGKMAQRRLSSALCVVAVLVGFLLLTVANTTQWQLVLFAAVISCVLLRRVVRPQFPSVSLSPFTGGVVLLMFLNAWRTVWDTSTSHVSIAAATDTDRLVFGGLFMLVGVLITAGQWAYRLVEEEARG